MESNDQKRPGADLIFLSEFPVGVLSDQPAEVKSVSFELKEKGKRKAKRWIINAGASFGLPNYVDMQLFILYLAYTKEQGFPEQVHFCRHRLLQDLGWSRGQENYDRVQLGLDRLVATTYTAINHYPDPKGRECVRRKAFHLLESYDIHDSRRADADLPPSWFRWSDEVRVLLQTRQLKTLDLEVFRTLKRPVSQAMYRYLHTRHLDGKATFEENLVEYACERLGLSRDFRWAADLKRTLNQGHRELIEKGLIAEASYQRMRAEKEERPQQKVVIHFPAPPALPPAAAPPEAEPVAVPAPAEAAPIARLVEAGVTRAVAAALVAADPLEVEQQLAYWPHRDPSQYANPSGALRRAIEERWEAPEGWKQARVKQQRQEKAKERRLQTQATEAQAADTAARFDRWLAEQPQQETWIGQALDAFCEGNATVRQHLEKHPERLREALRPTLLQITGWAGDDRIP